MTDAYDFFTVFLVFIGIALFVAMLALIIGKTTVDSLDEEMEQELEHKDRASQHTTKPR